MIKELMLFTPGPVMTSNALKSSLGHPDMPHRKPGFEKVPTRVQKNLLTLFKANDEYGVVIISGSGTAAYESVLSSVILESDEVLLIKNGLFSERLEEILACYKYKVHQIEIEWEKSFNLADIDQTLNGSQT